MTVTSDPWGELRSLCQLEGVESVRGIARVLDQFDASSLPNALDYAVDYVAKWPQEIRAEAHLPYTRWSLQQLNLAFEHELAEQQDAMVAVVERLQVFYPESIPVMALMERHHIRTHLATQTWETLPQLGPSTRKVFAQLAGELPMGDGVRGWLGEQRPNLLKGSIFDGLFQRIQIDSEVEGWEYMVLLVARADVYWGIAGLLVLLQQTQDHAIQKAITSYLKDIISSTSYMGKYNRGYPFTERRAHAFIDLHRLARMPEPRGYAAASSSGEGAVQRVLSGRLLFQALTDLPDHEPLNQLIEMSRGPDDPVTWAVGEQAHWPPADLYEDPQAVVERIEAMPSYRGNCRSYNYDVLIAQRGLWF